MDNTCPSGFFCNVSAGGSVCKTGCDGATQPCNGSTCVDVSTDSNNCGACAVTCGSSCSGGECVRACTLFGTGCPSGQTCEISFESTSVLWGTDCRKLGTVAAGNSCNATNQCAAGLECLTTTTGSTTGTCFQLCDASHACPSGNACFHNPNIPGGGGYCGVSVCGASNFDVTCTDQSGSCPAHSQCVGNGKCQCLSGYTAFTCEGAACSGNCNYPDWWCD